MFAPSVRYAMGHYIESLANLLAEKTNITLVVPQHYNKEKTNTLINTFKSGSRKKALFKNINPLSHIEILRKVFVNKPEIIHIINSEGYPWSISVALFSKLFNIPLVVTVHDPTPHPGAFYDIIASKLRLITLLCADQIHIHYFDSKFNNNYKFASKKTVIIPHLSFADRFLKYACENIKREELILFFGRLEKYKGIEVLVEAGKYLSKKTKIVIAGPGLLPKNLVSSIHSQKGRFILYNNFLTDKEVCNLFQRSKVCVLPYLQATQSSLPQTAYSFGLQIVASNTGTFTEEIPKLGGTLVEPGNPEQLATALRYALNKNVSKITNTNSNTAICNMFIELYKNVS